MTYTAQKYDHLLGLDGFSDALLTNHFGLYEGYVKNTNLLIEKLANDEKGTPEYAELKRRFGWEFNGMRLHELYFGNMTQDASTLATDSTLHEKIAAQFGSMDAWKEDFLATGAMRGIGWVILAYDAQGDRLFNTWINEHDLGHLAGCTPLLVMDVFEHAFVLDYGVDRASYIAAFMAAIDWTVVSERLQK